MTTTIYIVTHKSYELKIKKEHIYKDLLLGAALGNKGNADSLKDDTGNNISSKNKSFCELTGIYWIWKNSTSDIIGLDHYRRFFVKSENALNLLSENDIKEILARYDIIMPKRNPNVFSNKTAAQFFGDQHDPLVWTLCRDYIKENFPTYLSDFDWFSREKTGYVFTMFIGRKEVLDEYFEWLFQILNALEKEVDLSIYDDYNKRMYGFVAERLINVWVHHKNLKVKEVPVYMTDKPSLKEKMKSKIISLNKKIAQI